MSMLNCIRQKATLFIMMQHVAGDYGLDPRGETLAWIDFVLQISTKVLKGICPSAGCHVRCAVHPSVYF